MRRAAVVLALGLIGMTSLSAMFMMREIRKVPVARLVENLERHLRDFPENVSVRLNLARLYAMAYALKVTEFDADGSAPWFGDVPNLLPGPARPAPSREHQERAKTDLARAEKKYSEVVRMAPDNFIARLGHAWTLEESGNKAGAITEYRKTVELAWPGDRKQEYPWQDPATLEAARRLLVLLDPARDEREMASLREKVVEIGKKGRTVTPISIPLTSRALGPPLDPSARVLFDADGTGKITSALDWFGSVTFWLFWSNGYEALRALDDNGDGELRGTELRQLAIWHDRNQNGLSETGEVRPLAAHGIEALSVACQPGDGVDVAAYSSRGVLFADGAARPSYDILLRSVGRPVTLTAPEARAR